MTCLHVTRELANALNLPKRLDAAPDADSTALGPWSLGLVHCRPFKLVVAVSASTRWAMVLKAAPLATLQKRFGPDLLQNLLALGVPPDRARGEVDAHMPLQWALGHDRGVLTHLNQCAADALWAANDGMSLPSINQRLAERLIMKPQTCWVGEEVLRLLGGDAKRITRRVNADRLEWKGLYELMQSQVGQAVVTIPVQRLTGLLRLEARHQVSGLLASLPVDEARSLPSGRAARWIPGELVLDLQGIEAVSPVFIATLYAEANALGLHGLTLANASEEVTEQLRRAG